MRRRVELAVAVGVITAATIWWIWGALQPLPIVQDEYSYTLQAKIFAHGHWSVSPPPVPSSFQQPHVLTAPRVASKYPPGHALLLALGAVVGAPWLVPLVLSAISAVLIFLLAEPVVGPWIALFGWVVWLGDPINLRFRPGYFSEVTSGAAWLASWWLLRRWHERKQMRGLVFLGLAIGWMALTRPLTALAFAAPVGALVLVGAFRERLSRHVVAAGLAGTVVLSILPIWSAQTTGTWRVSPMALYRRDYLPFDKPGFGLDTTPPALPLSPVDADTYAEFAPEHRTYFIGRVPSEASARLRALAVAEWSGWRMALIPLAFVGIVCGTAELWFAIACAIALFIGYLSYAHWHEWTLYYFEAIPVLAFCAASGADASLRWIRQRSRSRLLRFALAGGTLALAAVCAVPTIVNWRRKHIEYAAYNSSFYAMVSRAPFRGMVVFVRYAPDQHPHTNVVTNSATLATDRVWFAIDNPSENAAVLRAANGRVPLLYEEDGGRLTVYRSLVQSIAGRDSLEY